MNIIHKTDMITGDGIFFDMVGFADKEGSLDFGEVQGIGIMVVFEVHAHLMKGQVGVGAGHGTVGQSSLDLGMDFIILWFELKTDHPSILAESQIALYGEFQEEEGLIEMGEQVLHLGNL